MDILNHRLVEMEEDAPMTSPFRPPFPKLWLVIGLFGVMLTFGVYLFRGKESPHPQEGFGNIQHLRTPLPNTSATSYQSRTGKATIVWLDADESVFQSRFGEILQLYSFKPDVTATSYQSSVGDATIIWVSGMDQEESPHPTAMF